MKMAAPIRSTLSTIFHRKIIISNLSQNRKYAQGIRQTLVNVLTPEEEQSRLKDRKIGKRDPRLDIDFNPFDAVKKNLPKISKTNSNSEKKPSEKKSRNIPKKQLKRETFGNLEFEILDDEDTNFGKVVMKAKSRKHREEKGEIILEGSRLIWDALDAGAKMKVLYFSGKDSLKALSNTNITAPLYKVSYRSMKIWSDTETPAGLLALFEKPKQGEAVFPPVEPIPVTLICDQIRDPGNMGTLIRTAAAVGCERILAMKGCVDVWDPKVLRAGAGSHFRVPIINDLPWEYIPGYIPSSCDVYAADVHKPTQQRIDRISKTTSDNLQQILEIDETVESVCDSEDDMEEDVEMDDSFKNIDVLKKYEKAPVPVKMYYDVKYSTQSNILVIGGETQGISSEARKLAFDHCGQVIMIPMCAGVNSLNTSIAGSVILYEMYKHLKKA